ncbi:hypothetical protein HY030_01545 [Candidatus Gottesmanbacteria bacterium]|nr:hypothetical protein [Candidatus Gottesmanbacteria bacterium]
MFNNLLKKNKQAFFVLIAIFLVLDFVFFFLLQFSKPAKNTNTKTTETATDRPEVNLKELADNLYLNLDFDADLVADGDLLTLNYIFINRSKQPLLAKDFTLSLNFAGPLEQALNSGRIIKDISQDILPGETVSGQAAWAVKDYENRQGGLFNVSLYLAYKDKNGKLIPVTSHVKQIRWL